MSRNPQNSADTRQPKGHGAKPAAVREAAILALLSEPTLERAAKKAGVNERTLRTWLASDTKFKTEYEAARRATFQAGISRIHSLTARAVETLEDLLEERKHPAVRLGAARTVAELAMHQYDAETILKRLDELEAVQSRGKP